MKLASFCHYFLISRQFQLENIAFLVLKWVSLKKMSCLAPSWDATCIGLLQLWWASYGISSKWSGFEHFGFYRYLPLSVWGMSKRSLNLSVVGALCKAADIPSPSAQWTYWMEHHLLKAEVTSSRVFTLHFALSFLPFAGRSRGTDSPSPHL